MAIIRKKIKKVVVAMSGGVDSAVAAFLLQKADFEVGGVFMKVIDDKQAEMKAKKVTQFLNIPLKVIDLRKEFKRRIINYYLKEYQTGRTPNTCVNCNQEIKFGLLRDKAFKMGADFFATGHYARLCGEIRNPKSGIRELFRGIDKTRDQSYFLWRLSRKQLKNVLLPLGSYTKQEVKEIAKKNKLPVLDAKESRENCFIKDTNKKFLEKHLKPKPGLIVDENGRKLGRHEGIAFYTVGQRRGIELPGGPYYVLEIKAKNNLIIATKEEELLAKKFLIVRDVNWIANKAPKLPLKAMVQIRYGHKAVPATIYNPDARKGRGSDRKHRRIQFIRPQRAITPGQSAVFYSGQELLGGGIIC